MTLLNLLVATLVTMTIAAFGLVLAALAYVSRYAAPVLLLLLLSAATVSAQTHPCDAPDQTVATKGSRLGWCHDRKDADGFAITQAIGWRVTVNGTVTDLGTMQPIGTSPNSAGLWYFEALLPTGQPRGTYPVFVTAYSAEGPSLPSTTISWQIGGPPNKPVKPRVAP
jgi:hypothetical protein